jgi:uncharacterized protein YuzE
VTTIHEVKVPMSLKVGNQWYGGGNKWQTGVTSFDMTIREPKAAKYQKKTTKGWWFWKRTNVENIDESIVNDVWTTTTAYIRMGQSATENLINGSITIMVDANTDIISVEPWTAESNIKCILLGNIGVKPVLAVNKADIENDLEATLSYIYRDEYTMKNNDLEIKLTSGSGPYGCSKGSFSTDQQVITGINIEGFYRSGATYQLLDCSKIVAQSILSQYKQPRIKLTASLDVSDYLLDIQNYLIRDSNYLPDKSFYVVGGTYDDALERFNGVLLELADARENIS